MTPADLDAILAHTTDTDVVTLATALREAWAATKRAEQERDAATARVAALEGALRDSLPRCVRCSAYATQRGSARDALGSYAVCDDHTELVRGAEEYPWADTARSLATTEGT